MFTTVGLDKDQLHHIELLKSAQLSDWSPALIQLQDSIKGIEVVIRDRKRQPMQEITLLLENSRYWKKNRFHSRWLISNLARLSCFHYRAFSVESNSGIWNSTQESLREYTSRYTNTQFWREDSPFPQPVLLEQWLFQRLTAKVV